MVGGFVMVMCCQGCCEKLTSVTSKALLIHTNSVKHIKSNRLCVVVVSRQYKARHKPSDQA